MSTKRVLVTAGLPYANGDLHIGHMAGCYLPADIYTRFLKLKGIEARYVCGSDDHGVAIALSAAKQNKTPAEIVEYYSSRQQEAFKGMDIDFDVFGSTSRSKYHQALSNDMFLKIFEKGLFSKEVSEQFYDEKKETFLPDRYVKGTCGYCKTEDQYGDQCENCGKILDPDHLLNPVSTLSDNPVGRKETTHWFLDLSKAEPAVKEWAEKASMREGTRNYVQSLIKSGLVKRSMTRDTDWGLPVPLDDPEAKGKSMYVWFDAPIGYISNTQEMCINEEKDSEEYLNWWNNKNSQIVHFIGEDNTIFHCIIWIAMLHTHGGYELPEGVIVNNFLNIKKGAEISKISKSRGNAIWILDYLKEGNDKDYLRYFLTYTAPEKSRSYFDPDEYVSMVNSDLADTLGNFINRSLSFSLKFVGENLPEFDEKLCGSEEENLRAQMKACFEEVTKELEAYSTRNAIKAIFNFARDCNKYFNDKAPWATRKTDMEVTKVTLGLSIQSIYFLGVMLQPFLPTKAASILSIFGINEAVSWDKALDLPDHKTNLTKVGILFQKIEL